MKNILIASGNQHSLRNRFVKTIVDAKGKEGWSIHHASVWGDVDAALAGGMFLDESALSKTLIVVSEPHKIDVGRFEEYKDKATLLLHYEGKVNATTKFGKLVTKLKGNHKSFNASDKPWEAVPAAVEFVVEEVKSYNLVIEDQLASAIVKRVGADFGVLIFEIQKYAAVAALEGSPRITAAHVKGALAELLEADVGPLLEAMKARNVKALLRHCARIRLSAAQDPTMKVVRILASQVITWFKAVCFEHMPPNVAAQELGLNAWYFKHQVLPPAKAWGRERLISLIKALAECERAVLSGYKAPWIYFQAKMVQEINN